MKHFYRERFLIAFVAILSLFVIGSLGYRVIEGWPLFDGVYMTMITLATIGYGETHELSNYGRLFTMFLIVAGLGIFGYSLSIFTTFLVEGELKRILKRKKMETRVGKMTSHYIVCGAGNTGRWIVDEILKAKEDVVVIDKDPKRLEFLENQPTAVYIVGDGSREQTLLDAGIHRASGLITALSEDKENLFVVLTARGLNPKLKIISRVIDGESEKKLLMAGATGTVNPQKIGGLRLASMMLRPTVVTFLDTMMRVSKVPLRVEEAEIQVGSSLQNVTLGEARIPERTGLLVVAVKKKGDDADFFYNPPQEYILRAHDVVIIMGSYDNLRKLKELATAR
ncbi:MAG: hypothetical protein A2284_08100 [Deltaproteobacteria bacterium RIFOXYA12_FULL_61_11]|nr:MAG: hypothetical protein A2284_08100 [Deltaproteobacteria bacterium RIFOXYA12_FULL_61_11]